MKRLRDYLRISTIVHILCWFAIAVFLELITGADLPGGAVTAVFFASFISMIAYFLAFGFVILVQLIYLIAAVYDRAKHRDRPADELSCQWQVFNILINAALLVVSPFHELWGAWMSV